MNNTNTYPIARDAEILQTRVALRMASNLSEVASQIPHDVQERLRFAREQALTRARQTAVTTLESSTSLLGGGALGFAGGSDRSPWWIRVASILPLVVLLAGLTLIQDHFSRAQIEAAAEIDAEILADEVPPVAYSDPGFVEFLKYPLE